MAAHEAPPSVEYQKPVAQTCPAGSMSSLSLTFVSIRTDGLVI